MRFSQPLREGSVQARTIWFAAAGTVTAAMMAACMATKPHTYGAYTDFAPKVAPQQGERIPQHLTVQVNRPANVAVFFVVPGRGSQLLFPADSAQTGFLQSGPHLVETSLARQALSDTSRLLRRPNTQAGGQRGGQQGARGRGNFDPNGQIGGNTRGYLLVYASQEPLPYNVLSTRVNGISIPIDDDDALNTVTKLIRETTHTTGTWAAYAAEFPP